MTLFFYGFMTRVAYRNNVHSMFFIITIVMMIMLRLFSAYYTWKVRSGFNFSPPRGIVNSTSSSKFFREFCTLYYVAFALGYFPFFCAEIFLLIFFNIFPVFLLVSFMGFRYFFWIVFSIFFRPFYTTLFTIWITVISPLTMVSKIFDWLDCFTSSTSFFHLVLQNKMPLLSWVKHESKGRSYFNTQSVCLTQSLNISNYTIG